MAAHNSKNARIVWRLYRILKVYEYWIQYNSQISTIIFNCTTTKKKTKSRKQQEPFSRNYSLFSGLVIDENKKITSSNWKLEQLPR